MADTSNNDSVEIWKPVPGWELAYEVSNAGRVRSIRRDYVDRAGRKRQLAGTILKAYDRLGYPTVELNCMGRAKKYSVHILVCTAFHGAAKPGQEVAHGDGNSRNAAANNLRWATRSENHADKWRHGTQQAGERHPQAKLAEEDIIKMRELYRLGSTQNDLAVRFGTDQTNVSLIVRRKAWRHV